MEIHDTPDLINRASVVEVDVPEFGLFVGDLVVELHSGRTLSIRRIKREDLERALADGPDVPANAVERVNDDDQNAELLNQVMEELERRWPDLL